MLLGNQSNPGGQVASGRERRPIAYLCDQRGCDYRTDARYAQPPAFLTRSVPGVDGLFDGADLYSQGCILAGQSIEAEPCSGWNAIVLLVSDDLDQFGRAVAAFGRDDTEFSHMPANRIRQHRPLTNQKFSASM